ncbi:MAG: creatininase family protein [Polyangiales bacterium]
MIRLFDLPHARAVATLAAGATVHVPVNPVEFHGRHLSLRNDHHVSMGLARDLHARRSPGEDLVATHDLELGVNPAAGRGSRFTPFLTARAAVLTACDALVELGARRVIFATFHGDPLHNLAIDAGVQRLRARGVDAVSPFNALLQSMLTLDPSRFSEAVAHVDDEAERAALLHGLALDFHAGFFETSLALHYAPETVDPSYVDLAPCPSYPPHAAFDLAARAAARLGRARLAAELRFAAWGTAWKAVAPRAGGYTGAPHRATAAAGRVFADAIVDLYAEAVAQTFSHAAAPPAPILAWVGGATLGGRITV